MSRNGPALATSDAFETRKHISIRLCTEAVAKRTGNPDVTEVIVSNYSRNQRQSILTLLWRVIDADNLVAEWEEVFVNHVARAVGLSKEEAELARRGTTTAP